MTELKDPRETVKASEAAIKAGDVDSMVNLYEPEAMFVSTPGQVAA
jgi:ketosteroid isomerase-like protein